MGAVWTCLNDNTIKSHTARTSPHRRTGGLASLNSYSQFRCWTPDEPRAVKSSVYLQVGSGLWDVTETSGGNIVALVVFCWHIAGFHSLQLVHKLSYSLSAFNHSFDTIWSLVECYISCTFLLASYCILVTHLLQIVIHSFMRFFQSFGDISYIFFYW